MYNGDEVVASRRAAGWAVNLDGNDPRPPKQTGAVRFGEYPDQPDGASTLLVSGKKPGLIADVNSEQADARTRSGKAPKKKPKVAEAVNHGLRDDLNDAGRLGWCA